MAGGWLLAGCQARVPVSQERLHDLVGTPR
eukprot:COSAG01_NODE_65616_length_272_cov_6.549133_1_plen_29_part_10